MDDQQAGSGNSDSSRPDDAQHYEVLHMKLDQYSAHRFMQTLRQHAGTTHRFDAPHGVPRPKAVAQRS